METNFNASQIKLLAIAYGRSFEYVEADVRKVLAAMPSDQQRSNYINETVRSAKGLLGQNDYFHWLKACGCVIPAEVVYEMKQGNLPALTPNGSSVEAVYQPEPEAA